MGGGDWKEIAIPDQSLLEIVEKEQSDRSKEHELSAWRLEENWWDICLMHSGAPGHAWRHLVRFSTGALNPMYVMHSGHEGNFRMYLIAVQIQTLVF